MKVTDYIKKAKGTVITFEILPPKKGDTIDGLFCHMDKLMEFEPPFIAVTYHREEYVYKKLKNNEVVRFATKRRPGTVGICAAIQNRYKVDAIPHMICGGFTKEETESALIDLNFLGIDNVLILRGDPVKSEKKYNPTPYGHKYASDLLKQVIDMNNGFYLHEETANANKTKFCKGVAAYPEKHNEASSLEEDISYLKLKADMGADYAFTQMFFDNSKYFNFLKLCDKAGINIPIIPGIKPITTKRQIEVLPKIFNIKLPTDLMNEIKKCKDDSHVKQVGIEWCIEQSKELIKEGVSNLHFYTMGLSVPTYQIVKSII